MKYKIVFTVLMAFAVVFSCFTILDKKAQENYVETSTEYINKQAEYIEELESMVSWQSRVIEQQAKELDDVFVR